MSSKVIRLKKLLLSLMLVMMLTETTGSQVELEPEINLPTIVFRKQYGTSFKFQEASVQNKFCAAFPVSDDAFLTSAHCLATTPTTSNIDLVGLGNVDIEKIEIHPVFDLATFKLKDRKLIPGSGHVGLHSKTAEDTCTVLFLNEAFRWINLHGVTPTRCIENALKDNICFKSEKIPTGLDFAIVCENGRKLHAVFHRQRGSEISFTDCSTGHCSEIIKPSANTREKRQTDDDTAAPAADGPSSTPDDAANTPTGDTQASPAADDKGAADKPASSADTVTSPAGTVASPAGTANSPGDIASPANTDGSSTPVDSTALDTDAGNIPLPPPNQLFPNMPKNFPYPNIDVVQNPPVPTKARKRPGFQNSYPVPAAKENLNPEHSAMNSVPTPQIKEQPIPVVAKESEVSVQLPMRTQTPTTSDLTEYEVLGAHDAPVLLANNDVKEKEAPDASQHATASQHVTSSQQDTASNNQYVGRTPATVQHQVQRPSSGGFAMAPADWRYSVTPRPHRKCKTTTSRPSCRGAQPSPAEAAASNYHGQMAATVGEAVGVADPSRPVGPDPWMVAAHEAVPTGIVNSKEDEKVPEGTPVESAADTNGLTVIILVLANALYLLF